MCNRHRHHKMLIAMLIDKNSLR